MASNIQASAKRTRDGNSCFKLAEIPSNLHVRFHNKHQHMVI